jgi:hypothetical protein
MVRVRDVAVIVNDRLDEDADEYPAFAVIDEEIVQVPASTKVTSPEDESIVHTLVVELEYDFVPAPADAVADIVGGELESVYGPESPLNVNDRESAVITMSTAADVAEACGLLSVIDAVIVQVPASTKATSPEDESIVQTDVVELE